MLDLDRPYIAALKALTAARVDFVLVGVGGVNFYARDPSVAFVTRDLDLWLRPSPENLRLALRALANARFAFEAGGEPFVDVEDLDALRSVIEMTSTLVARAGALDRIDLMLALHDFRFDEVSRAARRFPFAGTEVAVAPLDLLLESKRRAGREKDLRFLEAFAARRDEFFAEPATPLRPPKKSKRPKK